MEQRIQDPNNLLFLVAISIKMSLKTNKLFFLQLL